MFAVATPFEPVASWLPVIPADAAMSTVVIVASTMLSVVMPLAPVPTLPPVTWFAPIFAVVIALLAMFAV